MTTFPKIKLTQPLIPRKPDDPVTYFQKNRPRSVGTIHRAIRATVSSCKAMALQLEKEYLEGFQDQKAFIYYHLVNLHSLAVAVQAANPGENPNAEPTSTTFAGEIRILTSEQLEELIERANSTGTKAIAILDKINAVKKLRQLIVSHVSGYFNTIIDLLHPSMLVLDQYCTSFSELCNMTSNLVTIKNKRQSNNASKDVDFHNIPGADVYMNKRASKAMLRELERRKSNKELQGNDEETAKGETDEDSAYTSLLQTPVKYELSRLKLKETIITNLREIRHKAFVFTSTAMGNNGFGIDFEDFTMECQALGRRCRVQPAPFLLLVPEIMERLRNVCEALIQWSIEDKGYLSEMQNDIEKLSQRRISLEDQKRIMFTTLIHWRHKENELRKKLEQAKSTSLSLENRRKATNQAYNEAQLRCDKLDIMVAKARITMSKMKQKYENQLKMEKKAREIGEIKTNIQNMTIEEELIKSENPFSLNESVLNDPKEEPQNDAYPVTIFEIKEQAEELRDLLHKKVPEARKAKRELKTRFKWFTDLANEAKNLEDEWQEAEGKRLWCQEEVFNINQDLKSVCESRSTLQYLLALKSNSSSLRRIFHGIEIERFEEVAAKRKKNIPEIKLVEKDLAKSQLAPIPLKQAIKRSNNKDSHKESEKSKPIKSDVLDKAIKWVSSVYKGPWEKLFYLLPFRPSRGLAELDETISKIYCNMVRGDKRELVQATLVAWRRMDVCANLGAIWEALNSLEPELCARYGHLTTRNAKDGSNNSLARAFKKKFNVTIVRGMKGRQSSLLGGLRQPPMSALSKSIRRITAARLKQLREEAIEKAVKAKKSSIKIEGVPSAALRPRSRKLSSRFLRRRTDMYGMPVALTFTAAEIAAANRIHS